MQFFKLFTFGGLVAGALCAAIASETGLVETQKVAGRDSQIAAFNLLDFIVTGFKSLSGVDLLVAMGSLVSSTFTVVQCKENNNCVQASFDVVMAAWSAIYAAATFKRDDGEDEQLYTLASNETDHTLAVHMPIESGQSLRSAAIATGNNGTWHHIVTFHHARAGTWFLHYRLASQEDLGVPNDGTYHHMRAHKVGRTPGTPMKRGDEDAEGGVVADYLWQDNKMPYWDMFENINTNALGNSCSEYILDRKSEASCAVPAIDGVSGYGSEEHYAGVDQGVLAYGYNNQPFGFDGRSQGWINECGVAAGSPGKIVNP